MPKHLDFTPPDFTIDPGQANIVFSNIKVAIFADDAVGSVSWSLSADQYNKTQSNDKPHNGTLYLNLLDDRGAIIPSSTGKKITMFPGHTHCRNQGNQVWQGTAYGYPTGQDLLTLIKNVSLSCEAITYVVGPC
ncbi:hypothetical protein ACTGJ9_022875 [Bradyrhizobium sp. RDM12]